MDEKVIKVPVAGAMEDEKVVKVPAPLMVDNKVWPVTSMEIKKKKEKRETDPASMGAALLPVTFSTGIKKNKSWMLLPVQEVLKWALFAAVWVAVTLGVVTAIVCAGIPIPSSLQLQPGELTPAQEAELDSFGLSFLWLIVPEAAAAAAGLLLPRRHARGRWSLALVAIVSATVVHYMTIRIALVFIAARPGNIVYDIVAGGGGVLNIGFDLLCLISLLIGGPE